MDAPKFCSDCGGRLATGGQVCPSCGTDEPSRTSKAATSPLGAIFGMFFGKVLSITLLFPLAGAAIGYFLTARINKRLGATGQTLGGFGATDGASGTFKLLVSVEFGHLLWGGIGAIVVLSGRAGELQFDTWNYVEVGAYFALLIAFCLKPSWWSIALLGAYHVVCLVHIPQLMGQLSDLSPNMRDSFGKGYVAHMIFHGLAVLLLARYGIQRVRPGGHKIVQGGQDAAVAARVEPVGEVSPNFCAKCGGRLAAAAKFCSACGKAITIPQDDLAKLVQDLSRKRNEVQLERPIQLTSHPVPTAVPEQHYNATPPVVIQSPTKFALPRKDGDWGWLTFVCALVATMLLWVLIDNLPHVHNANTFKLPLAAAAGECFAFYLLGLVCTAIIAGFRKTRVSKRDVTYASWVFAFLALVGSWTITPEAPQLPPLPAGYTLDAPAAQPSPQSPPTNAPPVDPATQNSQATLKPYTGEVFPTQAQAEQDLARRLDARAAQWYKVYPFLDVNSPQANQAAIDDVLMRRDMLIRAGTEPVAALDAAVRETMAQPQADGAQAVVARTRSTETDNRPKWEQLMCPNPYTYVKPYDLCCLNADPKGTCVRPKT